MLWTWNPGKGVERISTAKLLFMLYKECGIPERELKAIPWPGLRKADPTLNPGKGVER